MARIKSGHKAVSIVFSDDEYAALDEAHWASKTEIADLCRAAILAAIGYTAK